MVLNSIFFLISTCLRNKKRKKNDYNFFIGFILMAISTIIGIIISSKLFSETQFVFSEYVITISVFLVLNFYIALNSSFLIRFRQEKFYQHETYYAFFCYWGDIFFLFWYEMLFKSGWLIKK